MVPAMLDYCGTLCRQHDRDRFVLSLRAPVAARPALWALYAFNYEIARTREVVTDPALGRIRLQWWRDAVNEAFAAEKPFYRHEILRHLAPHLTTYKLPAERFHSLIDAREADFAPADAGIDALESYAAATNLPLLDMALMVCGENASAAHTRAVAAAYGLTGLLRAHHSHTVHGGAITDSKAVKTRAQALLAQSKGAGTPLLRAHRDMTALYLRRLDRHGSETAPFLLMRLIFASIPCFAIE